MSERIVAAAIRFPGGAVLTAPHHHQIIRYAAPLLGVKTVKGVQGFITDRNRFVERKEGARIARAAGQVKEDYGSLMSEQMWEVPDSVFLGEQPAAEPERTEP